MHWQLVASLIWWFCSVDQRSAHSHS